MNNKISFKLFNSFIETTEALNTKDVSPQSIYNDPNAIIRLHTECCRMYYYINGDYGCMGKMNNCINIIHFWIILYKIFNFLCKLGGAEKFTL